MSSYFDEKGGVVLSKASWGQWYQTADEVVIEIEAETDTSGKDVAISIQTNKLSCHVKDQSIVKGNLFGNIIVDESTWSIEDRRLIRILLVKTLRKDDKCWRSLLRGEKENYVADEFIYDQMQRKIALERYQIDNPGFDFSSAELTGNYKE